MTREMEGSPIRRPRIKPEHAPYRTPEGNVRIGGGLYGIAGEVEDPAGWLWTLVNSLDGTRGLDRLIADVRHFHPEVSAAEIQDATNELIQSGHVEDIAALPPTDLTMREQERYGRSAQFYRWIDLTPRVDRWEVQRILKGARVVLVGVGGAGGSAATALVASGVGHLHCIDSDVVELSNLNRQTLYSEDDLGKPKVDAAVARLRRLNSEVEVTGEQRWLETQDDYTSAVAGYDLLAMCADRPDGVRPLAGRACLAAGVPWVDGGYHGALITVGGYVPGAGPCWECVRYGEAISRNLPVSEGDDLAKALPKAPGNPVTAVSAGLSGQWVAHMCIALLTGTSPVIPGAVYGMNLLALGEPIVVRHPRRAECPACGEFQ